MYVRRFLATGQRAVGGSVVRRQILPTIFLLGFVGPNDGSKEIKERMQRFLGTELN